MNKYSPISLPIHLRDDQLLVNDQPLLLNVPQTVEILPDALGTGVFLRFTAPKKSARHLLPLGDLAKIRAFTALHRYEPFWMNAIAGSRGGEIPIESQFAMVELDDHSVAVFVPILDGDFRTSLQGADEHGLVLVAESGDPALVCQSVTGLFIACGSDPYTLIPAAAESVMRAMGSGRLRKDKQLPVFTDQFGWCTWDAFYQEVSHEKVRQGLESLKEGGIQPGLLILDDGWQSEHTMPTGERRLFSFDANAKFPGGLSATVQMAKQEFGIQTFLVWHAVGGYWAGVDEQAMPGYDIRPIQRQYSPGILHYFPDFNQGYWGSIVGLVTPQSVLQFYHDYHHSLRLQGVDGVKVDNQASLEGLGAGYGGRVALMRRYREAMEGSAAVHFQNNLINCMSLSSEMLYSALNSLLTRSSTDFWPQIPPSHGLHLYNNAQVSLWFGEFIQPDWDMFQSGHPMGAFHAMGRAVSGGPVYVSDKPDAHDFAILRKLVLEDGSILRARLPGRPTRDCLFHNVTTEDVLLKIFSLNQQAGVLGVFNARYGEGDQPVLQGSISPQDVSGLEGSEFIVYAHSLQQSRLLQRDQRWEISLPAMSAEIFTIAPVEQGFAPLGLVEMYNSAGAITHKGRVAPDLYRFGLRGTGRCQVWCAEKPRSVACDGTAIPFRWDAGSQILEFTLSASGEKIVELACETK